MKAAEYLDKVEHWPKYRRPGDAERLIRFVEKHWRSSDALEHYARTYLPKTGFELGMTGGELLTAGGIETEYAWCHEESDVLSNFGILQIAHGGDTGISMVIDTGQILIHDSVGLPDVTVRKSQSGADKLEDFSLDKWLATCDGSRETMEDQALFSSFEEFDEMLLAYLERR